MPQPSPVHTAMTVTPCSAYDVSQAMAVPGLNTLMMALSSPAFRSRMIFQIQISATVGTTEGR